MDKGTILDPILTLNLDVEFRNKQRTTPYYKRVEVCTF